jgi:hypothetical protein
VSTVDAPASLTKICFALKGMKKCKWHLLAFVSLVLVKRKDQLLLSNFCFALKRKDKDVI